MHTYIYDMLVLNRLIVLCSVSDPLHFDVDPDPLPGIRIRTNFIFFFKKISVKGLTMFFFL